jgi:hypothetical protein
MAHLAKSGWTSVASLVSSMKNHALWQGYFVDFEDPRAENSEGDEDNASDKEKLLPRMVSITKRIRRAK